MDLIKIEERDGGQFVNARELHETLGVGRDFSNWVKDRIEKYGFVDGVDFTPDLAKSTGGRPAIDYLLSVNMAKELAIVENNEKGREIRQYLIKVETSWNSPEMVFARALQMANKVIDDTKKRLANAEEMLSVAAPKVESFEALQCSDRVMSITDAAKHFGAHPKTEVFPYLRDCGYLTSKDLPTQDALDAGYLVQRQAECPDGIFRPVARVMVSQLETWRTRVIPQIAAWKERNK